MYAIKLRQTVISAVACGLSIIPNYALAMPAQDPRPAVPSSVTATGEMTGRQVDIKITWDTVPNARFYRIFRDGGIYSTSTRPLYIDTRVTAGQSHSYYIKSDAAWAESAASATVTASAPAPMPPAAPTGVTATPLWSEHCPVCNGMAMPHIVLTWSAVSGATSYNVYRGGQKIQTGVTAATVTDMSVVSGQAYLYTVSSVSASGEGAQSVVAPAIAPMPPASAILLTAPNDLNVVGAWQGGAIDHLAWSPVRGAVTYNVYQYDIQIAKGLTSPQFDVPQSVFYGGLTYTVTAVDAMGMESLPSGPETAMGGFDPRNLPGWLSNQAPFAPTQLVAVSEWNNGGPRVRLAWHGDGSTPVYAVYRDGQKIASALWELAYFDADVHAGESHVYTVSGVNPWWPGCLESMQSSGASITVAAAPAASPIGVVQITGVQPNDDSAVVSFNAVPGAVDYRVYSASNPMTVKYSGGSLSIEMNGLDPVAGADLTVEAVDKFGPFQKMDGMAGPGAMQMNGAMQSAINGQGDPSNVPNVIARSSVFHVTCQPRMLTNSQVFFDTFRNEQPLVQSQMIDPAIAAANGSDSNSAANRYVREFSNDKWTIRDYWGDMDNTKMFFMGNHFMDTLYDGGTPRTNIGVHNNNASLVLMPKATADISGGKILHVTFEVDAHFGDRRWCDVFVGPANDPLLHPAPTKLSPGQYPTVSGNLFVWSIGRQLMDASEIIRGNSQALINTNWGTDPILGASERFGPVARINWDQTPLSNGTTQDLDKRHRFDLYLSTTHFRLLENGVVCKDRDLVTPLPFDQCQVYFTHEVYHTGNDRQELVTYLSNEKYWYNYRPWADERHWDNMGFEVQNDFPELANH